MRFPCDTDLSDVCFSLRWLSDLGLASGGFFLDAVSITVSGIGCEADAS